MQTNSIEFSARFVSARKTASKSMSKWHKRHEWKMSVTRYRISTLITAHVQKLGALSRTCALPQLTADVSSQIERDLTKQLQMTPSKSIKIIKLSNYITSIIQNNTLSFDIYEIFLSYQTKNTLKSWPSITFYNRRQLLNRSSPLNPLATSRQ